MAWHRLGRILGLAIAALSALVVAGLLVAWLGVFSVAASRGHWALVDWFLAFGMRNSVETRALMIKAPPLDSADLVRLGAGHFHGGCAYCHGAPGMPASPVAQQMLPPPPDLSRAAREWSDEELFWIVKHGIKYTGMPNWPALERDDEIWAVVAFLKRLPGLDAAGYRALALGEADVPERSGRELATTESSSEAVTACARCHGAGEHGPKSRLVPILHGQRSDFLLSALQAYAAGRRRSGIMQWLAAGLTQDAMSRIVDYYAHLPMPANRAERADPSAIQRGRKIATEGLPETRVPPCLVCHGPAALATYPRLAGQHARYMAGRLRLWKQGLRAGTEGAAVMAPIARQLNDRQIEDVSAYLASLPQTPDGEARRP